VTFDLYAKVEYVAQAYADKAAQKALDELVSLRSSSDKRKASSWEHQILSYAFKDVRLIDDHEHRMLQRLGEDRHLCAHPATNAEGLLFQPTPELARTHLRTAIELVLARPAVYGKAALKIFERDVEAMFFPGTVDAAGRYLEPRHLPATAEVRAKLFLACLRKVFYADPEADEVTERYVRVAIHLDRTYPNLLDTLERSMITTVALKGLDERLPRVVNLLTGVPRLWTLLPDHTKEKVKSFASVQPDLGLRLGLIPIIPEYEEELFVQYQAATLSDRRLFVRHLRKIAERPDQAGTFESLRMRVVRVNVNDYSQSVSYKVGRDHGTHLLEPVIDWLTEEDVMILLLHFQAAQIHGRNQLIDTGGILRDVLRRCLDQ